jgi:hypothetical protein
MVSFMGEACIPLDGVIVDKRDSSLLLLYYNEYNPAHDDEGIQP